MNKQSLRDLPPSELLGKRVFVRVDFNVPLQNGVITDDGRIRAAIPTIQHLIQSGARVIIASHLGRPKGKPSDEFSLKPVADRLAELLGKPVAFSSDCIGSDVQSSVNALKNGEILLLENVRFHSGEKSNDSAFAKSLSDLAELFVNDAFGTAHRAHASTAGIADYLPAVSGFLLEKELAYLGGVMESPERPFVAIIGGAKVSSKLSVLESMLDKVDSLIIGGGMAYTFLKAQGFEIGKSLCENDLLETANRLLQKADALGKKIHLPVDAVCAREFSPDSPSVTVSVHDIPHDMLALDIGPESVAAFSEVLSSAKTILWNGPLGVFEMDAFAKGTFAIAHLLSESNGVTIIGGGDSAAAIAKAGLSDSMTHISTGGGASLELLEGKILPGIAVLNEKNNVQRTR